MMRLQRSEKVYTLTGDEMGAVSRCPIFAGVESDDLGELFSCLGATVKSFPKNGCIFQTGEPIESVGIVVSGSILISHEDYWGKRAIISKIDESGIFGESFACAGELMMPVTAQAARDSRVMLVNCRKLLTTCPSACPRHTVLINNLASALAEKNVSLTQKLFVLSKRSIRERILAFFSQLAGAYGSGEFALPFSKGELADYLCVDRSAMSRELGKMQDEKLIQIERSSITLHKAGEGQEY